MKKILISICSFVQIIIWGYFVYYFFHICNAYMGILKMYTQTSDKTEFFYSHMLRFVIYDTICFIALIFSILLFIHLIKNTYRLSPQEIQERKALKNEKKKQNKIEKLESKLNEMKKDG